VLADWRAGAIDASRLKGKRKESEPAQRIKIGSQKCNSIIQVVIEYSRRLVWYLENAKVVSS